MTPLRALLWQKGLNTEKIASHAAKSHLLMILQMNLFTYIGYLSMWGRRGRRENNGESKYLSHLSSLLCLAVITNRGWDAKDCMAQLYGIMTHKQLVWEMKYGFNWCINVYNSMPNIKATTETLCITVAAIRAANNVYPSWWPNFHCCIFQANKHIFLNGCLSVRSVLTSTSHYSGQFPFKWSAIRESRMSAYPNPQARRNLLTESTNQQLSFGPDSLNVYTKKWLKWEKRMCVNHRSENKKPLCSSYTESMG